MSKPNYNLCDICGKKTNHGFFIPIDRPDDGAGGRADVGPTVDLCSDCMKDGLIMFITTNRPGPTIPDYEQGQRLADWIEKRRKNFGR